MAIVNALVFDFSRSCFIKRPSIFNVVRRCCNMLVNILCLNECLVLLSLNFRVNTIKMAIVTTL